MLAAQLHLLLLLLLADGDSCCSSLRFHPQGVEPRGCRQHASLAASSGENGGHQKDLSPFWLVSFLWEERHPKKAPTSLLGEMKKVRRGLTSNSGLPEFEHAHGSMDAADTAQKHDTASARISVSRLILGTSESRWSVKLRSVLLTITVRIRA